MRFTKNLTIGLAVAAIAASGATAHDKPGKSARCHPAPVMLAGTLASDPAAGDTSVQLTVKHANHLGRMYAKAGNPVSVSVDAKTLVRKDGAKSSLDALSQDDRAIVMAKVCRSDVRGAVKSKSALPAMTARLVLAKSPKSPPASSDGDDK
jgi:hypothetical protein